MSETKPTLEDLFDAVVDYSMTESEESRQRLLALLGHCTKRAAEAEARVTELEAEIQALDTCWKCQGSIKATGGHSCCQRCLAEAVVHD